MIEKHFTVTTYVIQEKKALLLHHPKFHKWLPPGGHLEPNETPPEGALREVLEETGLEVELIKQENIWIDASNASSFERPYLCLLENIAPHNGRPAHQHIDLIYIAKPIGGQQIKSDTLRWFSLEEAGKLRVDEEIFSDTSKMLKHLLIS